MTDLTTHDRDAQIVIKKRREAPMAEALVNESPAALSRTAAPRVPSTRGALEVLKARAIQAICRRSTLIQRKTPSRR